MGAGRDWEDGYDAGFAAGIKMGRKHPDFLSGPMGMPGPMPRPKRKTMRKASPKHQLLNKMTGTAWTKYKKGSGKKNYIQIRAQVSRSLEYKRRAKKL